MAGHGERDERVTTALVREAAEEAGIQLAEADVQGVHVRQRKGRDGRVYVDFFCLTEPWEGHMHNREPAECDDLRWFPLTALPTNTIPYIKDVLHRLLARGLGFSEYGWDNCGGAS